MTTKASMTFFIYREQGMVADAARCQFCGHVEVGIDKMDACRQMVKHHRTCTKR